MAEIAWTNSRKCVQCLLAGACFLFLIWSPSLWFSLTPFPACSVFFRRLFYIWGSVNSLTTPYISCCVSRMLCFQNHNKSASVHLPMDKQGTCLSHCLCLPRRPLADAQGGWAQEPLVRTSSQDNQICFSQANLRLPNLLLPKAVVQIGISRHFERMCHINAAKLIATCSCPFLNNGKVGGNSSRGRVVPNIISSSDVSGSDSST